MTGNLNSKGPICAIMAAALFGVSTPLAKLLLGEIEPVPLAALLYLGCGTGLFLVAIARRSGGTSADEAGLDPGDYPWLAGSILTGGVLAPAALFYGLLLTPAATASLLLNVEIIATTLIALFVLGEAIGRRALAAIVVITVAGIVLAWNPQGLSGYSFGTAAVTGACLLWGIDNNLTRKISGKDPLAIALVKGLGAGGVSLLLAMLTHSSLPGFGVVAAALGVGFITYGVSIVFFVRALRDLGAARTSAYFASAPFIGSIASLALFREIPGMQFFIALPLFLLGVTLLAGERHIPWHTHERIVHVHRHRHDEYHIHPHPGEDIDAHVHEHVHEPVELERPRTPDIDDGHER
jgi:drug/metabolite transporter (DMT)-like permease